MTWYKDDSESIFNASGTPVLLKPEEFQNICHSKRCFICGTNESKATKFNNEHVIPDWLQSDLNLYNNQLNLPNECKATYSTYKIRCCIKCNTKLAVHYENVVSDIIRSHNKGGKLNGNEAFLVFRWMALIFLKTFLRDRKNPNNLNRSLNTGYVADGYDWVELHHTHALILSQLANTECDHLAFGTFFTLPFDDRSAADLFDYQDILSSRCLMLRYKNTCFFAVLDDAGYCGKFYSDHLRKIDGPINNLQAREILAELALLRQHLSSEPAFCTVADLNNENSKIQTKLQDQEIHLKKIEPETRGSLIEYCIEEMIEAYNVDRSLIAEGKHTFLFNDKGSFENSMVGIVSSS